MAVARTCAAEWRSRPASHVANGIFAKGSVIPGYLNDFYARAIGELRLDDRAVQFAPGDALYIPADTWHAVANTGADEVTMVFGFPHPDYPPTERR